MVTLRARSCSKVSFSENNSEFFKVYLPRFSSQQLGIPPAFVRHVNGIIPRNIVLRDCAGRQWHGRIEEVAGDLVINTGWQTFASQHSLEHGDFLIFKYDGDSLFDVKIFGKNGCVKEETLSATMDTIFVKNEEETEAERITSRAKRACEQKHSEIALEGIAKLGCSYGISGFKTTKRTLRNLGESGAFKPAGYVVPKNPYFVSTFVQSANFYMSVSVSVVKSHGIKLKPHVMLCDKNGAKWPVKVVFRQDGRIALTSGWADFRRRNSLKIGDKCVFEFVLSSGNICKEMKVQLVRAGVAYPNRGRPRITKT